MVLDCRFNPAKCVRYNNLLMTKCKQNKSLDIALIYTAKTACWLPFEHEGKLPFTDLILINRRRLTKVLQSVTGTYWHLCIFRFVKGDSSSLIMQPARSKFFFRIQDHCFRFVNHYFLKILPQNPNPWRVPQNSTCHSFFDALPFGLLPYRLLRTSHREVIRKFILLSMNCRENPH